MKSNISKLNAEQSRDYNRSQLMETFFNENKPVYVVYVPFAKEVDDFMANWKLFKDCVSGKGSDGIIITKSKDDLKQVFADDAATICSTVMAYALKYNLPKLAASVNFSTSDILKIKDSDITSFAKDLTDIVSPLLTDANFIPYGTDQDALDELTAAAVAFNDEIGKAKIDDTNSGVANKKIDSVIQLINGNIKQFRLLIKWYKKKYPEFVEAFLRNIKKDNTGVRHCGIAGVITDAATGKAISKARVSIEVNGKTVVTDLYGRYELKGVRPGDYEVTFSAKGYADKTVVLHIYRSKISSVDMAL